jgi:hypothetical protein
MRGLRVRFVLQVLLAAGFGMAAGAPGLAGQTLMVATQQDLSFGQLMPGVATSVPPADVMNRAEVWVEGTGRPTVTFSLPSRLVSASGAQIPLTFGAADGLVIAPNTTATFDPRTGTSLNLHGSHQTATICVGGTAQPAPDQAAGSYNGTIIVYVIP